jgi:hypothetical protein
MRFSTETNHARDIRLVAEDVTRLLREDPTPGEIWRMLGGDEAPRGSRPARGSDETAVRYILNPPGRRMQYTVDIGEGGVLNVSCRTTFYLKRGISFETLEKIYTGTLGKFFGAPPKFTVDRDFPPRGRFVWTTAGRDGTPREISLRISRSPAPHYYFNKVPALWNKPERIEISFYTDF